MLRNDSSSMSDKINKYALQSIYNSIAKYNNRNTNCYYEKKEEIGKHSFFSGLLIAFLAGYHFRLLIESKNIS